MADLKNIPDLEAFRIRDLVLSRQISPVEVVEATLERIEKNNATINAICTLDAERSLDTAKSLEKKLSQNPGDIGSLAGLPVGIKDTTDTAGLRTTYGSPLYRDHVPVKDAEVVSRVRKADGIVIGKTNTPEFATGGVTDNDVFGPTCNPWNTEKISGGSTGGGAAGLASGMFALATGTDHGGSLRQPASLCGVVGLRPSVGLVPGIPSSHYWQTMSVDGPMARSAVDVALILEAISGVTQAYPISTNPGFGNIVEQVFRYSGDGKRFAYIGEICDVGIDPGIEKICRTAANKLSATGAEIEEIEFDLSEAREVFITLRGQMMVTTQYKHLERIDELGENLAGNIRLGLGQTTEQLAAAENARGQLMERFIELFRRYDAVLTPCVPIHAFGINDGAPTTIGDKPMKSYIDWMAPTFVLSLFGLPTACAPAGLTTENMPTGMQIVGPRLADAEILGIAGLLQQQVDIGSCFDSNDSLTR
ncbi:MAG: amidase [Methyloligellaceae bacterium]